MIVFMNADILHVPPPNQWREGIDFVPSSRPGWFLLRVSANPDMHASMLPNGTFQADSPNDGSYEQCLPAPTPVAGQTTPGSIVFQPRNAAFPDRDYVVGAVFAL